MTISLTPTLLKTAGMLLLVALFSACGNPTTDLPGTWVVTEIKPQLDMRDVDPELLEDMKNGSLDRKYLFYDDGTYEDHWPGEEEVARGSWRYNEQTEELVLRHKDYGYTERIKIISFVGGRMVWNFPFSEDEYLNVTLDKQ